MANTSQPDPDYYDKCRSAVEDKDHLPLVTVVGRGCIYTRLFSVHADSPLRSEEITPDQRVRILAWVAQSVYAEGVREAKRAADL